MIGSFDRLVRLETGSTFASHHIIHSLLLPLAAHSNFIGIFLSICHKKECRLRSSSTATTKMFVSSIRSAALRAGQNGSSMVCISSLRQNSPAAGKILFFPCCVRVSTGSHCYRLLCINRIASPQPLPHVDLPPRK